MDCSSLDKLNKQSLLAKIIINCPELKHLIQSEKIESNTIYSTQEAFDNKQTEFYKIVNELIPENSKLIATARAHGDLKENYEYKSR